MVVLRLLICIVCILAPVEANSARRAVRPGSDPTAKRQVPPTIAIQPLGAVDRALIGSVTKHIQSVFAVRVMELPARALPTSAYYAPRNRYRGERILADLEQRTPKRMTKVLGVMSRDLSVTKRNVHDWGVLGVAGLSCRAAVVSIHRLGRNDVAAHRLVVRLNRVATHELGHTFGLSHCRSAGCIMNDARGTIHTVDRSSGRFCPSCARHLGELLRRPEA